MSQSVGIPPIDPEGSTQKDLPPEKGRRSRGACDKCRIKKSKCDSKDLPNNICTNCMIARVQCTHDLPNYYKKMELQQVYIRNLEAKIAKLEGYMQKIYPGRNIYRIIEGADVLPIPSMFSATNLKPEKGELSTVAKLGFENPRTSLSRSPNTLNSVSQDPPTADDEPDSSGEDSDLDHVVVNDALKRHRQTYDQQDRYFGQSSYFGFAKQALEGNPYPNSNGFLRKTYWQTTPSSRSFITSADSLPYIFPEEDLLVDLVSAYFDRANVILPILHRPTFLKSVATRQHLWDPSFGMIVLLVCAIGSQYSHDPRVLDPNDLSSLSAGWKFFTQVPIYRNRMTYETTIHDFQYYPLASLYLLGSSMPDAGWGILGIGLRYTLEMGGHRRKGNKTSPTSEDELFKRAFWALVCLDRLNSSLTGRPSTLLHEIIDVKHPIECDDEYWDTTDPSLAFKQPQGKPSSITSFVHLIRLCEILGFALRSLYTNKRSRSLTGFIGDQWEGKMVAELDSSLNKFMGSLPEHLKWGTDAAAQDPIFFYQSADLYLTYYYIQIQIHRQYLTKHSSWELPSLPMCTSAARSCSGVLQATLDKGIKMLPTTMAAAFNAGMVVILTLQKGHSIGYSGDREKDRDVLRKCLSFLKEYEPRWQLAGRLGDTLSETGVDVVPLESSSTRERTTPSINKRRREANDELELEYLSKEQPPPASELFGSFYDFSQRSSPPTYDMEPVTSGEYGWDLDQLLLTEMGYYRQDFEAHLPTQASEAMVDVEKDAYGHVGSASSTIADFQQGHQSSQGKPGEGLSQSIANELNPELLSQEWDQILGGRLLG